MKLQVIFPGNRDLSSLDDIQVRLSQSRRELVEPFSDLLIDFFSSLSEELFRENRESQFPELQALAFWMRKSALIRMRDSFRDSLHHETLCVPRGVSFHVTPSNVDTMPIYSLLLSLVCGNSNVVRVSDRSGPQFELVVDCMARVLCSQDRFNCLRQLITFLRYDRSSSEATATLSSLCDTRVLWGGDVAIDQIQQSPIPRDATELIFPDRTSWAVLPAEYWNHLSSTSRQLLLNRFFNDTLALDQLACSSPQTVAWLGEAESCRIASASFWSEFNQLSVERQYPIGGATSVKKQTAAWAAAMNADVSAVRQLDKVTVVSLGNSECSSPRGCGAGFFFERHLKDLRCVQEYLQPFDQTLAYAGMEREAVAELARCLNGSAFTRYTPIGMALEFSPLWEGKNLLAGFTKLIHVR